MGLDMYLSATKSFWNVDKVNPQINLKKVNDILGVKAKLGDLSSIKWEFLYWRKMNAIHKWFVENIQDGNDDCRDYHVDKEDLIKLRDICEQIIKDPTKASELLPTQDGFFFGGCDYDEYYMGEIKRTYEALKDISNADFNDIDFEYSSSW